MKILVINAGSSSLKFQLIDSGKNFSCLYKGLVDRIGFKDSKFIENNTTIHAIKAADHYKAIAIALEYLLKRKIIRNLDEIDAIGHRVVHGGEKYKNATKITPVVIGQIKKLCKFAPLHNPPNLAGILAAKKIFKNKPQVAVFDTAFHQTMPEKAFLYALPYQYYKQFGFRRYGFHGTSHLFVAKKTIGLLKKKKSKIITCHLGNGSSITAVENGKSIDTSMGFTPLEGLPMGTRSGDVDPAIVFELMEILKISTKQVDEILNKSSGLKGISGLSSDMRDLWKAYDKNRKARLAISILSYKAAKYIGSYAAALKGLDAITFTGGVGENAYYVRKEICDYFPFLGLKLDIQKNKKNNLEISAKNSKVKVYVIPTDEEHEIAEETFGLIKK